MLPTQTRHINSINLTFHDSGGDGTPLFLLHGLTANLHSFGGLMKAGLGDGLRVIVPDLRGRGDTDKPETGYHMEDHAQDMLGLMSELGLTRVIMAGHSFGGLLSLYLAANYPDAVEKVIVIDAGKEATHPDVLPKIKPSLDRLGAVIESADAFITTVKNSAYFADGFWSDDVEAYYRADLEALEGGAVRSKVSATAIEEAVTKIIALDWGDIISRVTQPALLIHAPQPITAGGAPVLSVAGAQETVALLADGHYVAVPGHHITMVFGDNAPHVVRAMRDFIG